MPNAARRGDMHACPSFTGIVPHVGGPVLAPCCPDILIEGLPAATVTDTAGCAAGGPDVIAMGCPTVVMRRRLAARVTDMTCHGGVVTIGAATVVIGLPGDGRAVLAIRVLTRDCMAAASEEGAAGVGASDASAAGRDGQAPAPRKAGATKEELSSPPSPASQAVPPAATSGSGSSQPQQPMPVVTPVPTSAPSSSGQPAADSPDSTGWTWRDVKPELVYKETYEVDGRQGRGYGSEAKETPKGFESSSKVNVGASVIERKREDHHLFGSKGKEREDHAFYDALYTDGNARIGYSRDDKGKETFGVSAEGSAGLYKAEQKIGPELFNCAVKEDVGTVSAEAKLQATRDADGYKGVAGVGVDAIAAAATVRCELNATPKNLWDVTGAKVFGWVKGCESGENCSKEYEAPEWLNFGPRGGVEVSGGYGAAAKGKAEVTGGTKPGVKVGGRVGAGVVGGISLEAGAHFPDFKKLGGADSAPAPQASPESPT